MASFANFSFDVFFIIGKFLAPRERFVLYQTCRRLWQKVHPFERRLLSLGVDPAIYLSEPKRCKYCLFKHTTTMHCPLKLLECAECKKERPWVLFTKRKNCQVCPMIVRRHHQVCLLCTENRCVLHKLQQCKFCLEKYDPYVIEGRHHCKDFRGKIIKQLFLYEKEINDSYIFTAPQKILCNPEIWEISATKYHYIHFITDLKTINVEYTHPALICYQKTLVAEFVSFGNFQWFFPNPVMTELPTFCFYCMKTSAKRYLTCEKCGMAEYCSRVCLLDDSKNHKINCE